MIRIHTYYTRANAWLAKYGKDETDILCLCGVIAIIVMCLRAITP